MHRSPSILFGHLCFILFFVLLSSPLYPNPPASPVLPQSLSTPELQRILANSLQLTERLDAFNQLQSSNALDTPTILQCITDISPDIRLKALQAGLPIAPSNPELALRLSALANDLSPKVRIATIPILVAQNTPRSLNLLTQVFLRDIDSRESHASLLPHLTTNSTAILPSILTSLAAQKTSSTRVAFLESLGHSIRHSKSEEQIIALLNICNTLSTNDNSDQVWIPLALLKGLLGLSKPIPQNSTPFTLSTIPPVLTQLHNSSNRSIRTLFTSQNLLLHWPQFAP